LSWTHGQATGRAPVVLLYGGPGVPDYLAQVAALIDDLTVDRHLQDLGDLLDGWAYDRVTLVGHSYVADLAALLPPPP